MAAPEPTSSPPHLDPGAFDALIESLDPPAILVVISTWMGERLKRLQTVEDIWQETLAMAWRDRHQHRWSGVRAYRAWLLTIAGNRIRDAADHFAAHKRGGDHPAREFSSLLSSDGSLSSLLPIGSTTPSRVAIHREEADAMERALRALPAELQQVVQLRVFEQLPMKRVAELAGIGLTSAKERFRTGSTMYRARLDELLGGSTGPAGPRR